MAPIYYLYITILARSLSYLDTINAENYEKVRLYNLCIT